MRNTPPPPPPPTDPGYQIKIKGAPRTPLRDAYHAVLRMPWSLTLVLFAGAFVVVNTLFAVAYLVSGGIANAEPGSFLDNFFFSVQTMGTIGYGAMYPASRAANFIVAAESLVGLGATALSTGLVFAKFARSTARVVFSRRVTISPMNGVPTLSFRIGNQRKNFIVDTHINVVLARTERTAEGMALYRMLDLRLVRERVLSLSRSWMVMHVIDEASPLYGETPESLDAKEAELQITVIGLDDASMQPVHAPHRYMAADIVWGARHADVLSEAGRDLVLDLGKFHDIIPTTPTERFPYPRSSG